MPNLSVEARSRIMRAIRGKNTRAELTLRSGLFRAGLRGYRIHDRTLPGTPDLAFRKYRLAVFVDGVFWHGHPGKFSKIASAHWRDRIRRNIERDYQVNDSLREEGWSVLRLWDQEILQDLEFAVDMVRVSLGVAGEGHSIK